MKFCVVLQNTEIVDVMTYIFKMALTIEKCTQVIKLYYENHSPVTFIRSMPNNIMRIRNLDICKYTY